MPNIGPIYHPEQDRHQEPRDIPLIRHCNCCHKTVPFEEYESHHPTCRHTNLTWRDCNYCNSLYWIQLHDIFVALEAAIVAFLVWSSTDQRTISPVKREEEEEEEDHPFRFKLPLRTQRVASASSSSYSSENESEQSVSLCTKGLDI
jgi:hypothetical protein